MTEAPVPEPPFERLGDYEVLAPISEGGMASVFLARPAGKPDELVALKVIRPEHGRNKEFIAMLVDEAAIASRLSHPNILRSRNLGHDGRQHYLVMELLRGHTLLQVFKAAHGRGKRLPPEVVAWIGARIADALHYAHELKDDAGEPLNVVHRDVNPANVLLTREGVPKLIDFGLAKARDRIASTAIGVVKGKLAYLAPEQAHGKPADRRSDVFALGVTLWELSTDRRLFLDESDVQTVRRVREADVPDPTTIVDGYPRVLADALVRALAKEPGDRWQTAAELRDALDAYVRGAGPRVDEASVRALSAELFGDAKPAPWERIADDTASDQERTRIWEDRKAPGGGEDDAAQDVPKEPKEKVTTVPMPTVALPVLAPPPAGKLLPEGPLARLASVAIACAVVGGVLAGLAVRGCGERAEAPRGEGLEQRVSRIEELLGMADAALAGNAPSTLDGGAVVSVDDRTGQCAVAKVAAYQLWQEAVAKAKANAAPAEAACADMWSDSKKQACYRNAMAQIRAAQAARDAVIAGGAAAHEAVRGTKDDPRNEAIARARASSQAAFTACDDESEGH